MPRTLVIRLDPHELGPVYAPNQKDFTLALTTSVDSTGAAAADPMVPIQDLSPWKWQAVSSFQVWNIPLVEARPVQPVGTRPSVVPPPAPVLKPGNWDAFVAALDASILAQAAAAGATYYDYAATPSEDPTTSFATNLAALHAIGTSTPQWLNLVSFIRLPAADLPAPTRQIAIVPVVVLASGVTLVPDLSSAVSTDPANPGGAAATFNYLPVAPAALPYKVRGEIQIDAPWTTGPNPLLDPANLLVLAGTQGNQRRYGADWLAGLSARLAEGADLPGHVIAWAEQFLSLAPPTIPSTRTISPNPTTVGLAKVRSAFLAACRTVAHAGARAEAGAAQPGAPTDPASLADDLLALLPAGRNPPAAAQRTLMVQKIRAADARADLRYQGFPDQWRQEFAHFLGPVANGLPLFEPVGLPPAGNGAPLTQDTIDRELAGLRTVNNALWDGAVAGGVITAQWSLMKDPSGQPLVDPGLVEGVLQIATARGRGIRRQLSLGSVGPNRWKTLLTSDGSQPDAVAISGAFPTLVSDHASGSLGPTEPVGFTSFVQARAKQFASLDVPPNRPDGTPDITLRNSLLGFDPNRVQNDEYGERTPAPHSGGLVYAFDTIGPSDETDYLNRLAGVVVFLKQGNAKAAGLTLGELATPANLVACFGDWRALNIADEYITFPAGGTSGSDLLREDGIVPAVRFSISGGVRHPLITYNAHPLIARSPATDLVGDPAAGNATAPAVSTINVLFEVANGTAKDWALLPELRFGQVYALQAYARTHAGALPSQLIAPGGHPAYLKPWQSGDVIGTVGPNGDVLARVSRYLRRVPVGTPVWQAAPGDPARLKSASAGSATPPPTLPVIPATVAPLAPELPPWVDGGSGKSFDLPLVLLQPKWEGAASATGFAFQLLLPTIDLETWDRWVATDGARYLAAARAATAAGDTAAAAAAEAARKAVRQQRIDVRIAYFKELSSRTSQRQAEPIPIDDPAVSGFVVTLIDRSPAKEAVGPGVVAAATPSTTSLAIKTLPPAGTQGLAAVRRGPISVSVAVSDGDWQLAYDPALYGLTITVPRESVIEVDISTLVPVAEFYADPPAAVPARMMARDDFGYAVLEGDATLVRCGMMRFVAEVATDRLPSPQELHDALVPSVTGEELRVVLDAKANAAKSPFAWCRWANLQRQVWRWDGRALAGFAWDKAKDGLAFDPADPTNGIGPDECAKWEVRGFGAHPDADFFEHQTRLAFNAKPSPYDVPLLYNESLEGDRRAIYERFAVTVISRYQGVIPPNNKNYLGQSSLGAAGPNDLASWRRLVVRSRWDRPLPRPKLRCLLPLSRTSATEAGVATTCLLAVFDETWYVLGGLAEELSVDVALAPDNIDTPTGVKMPEIGYDPIVNANSWDQSEKVSFTASGGIGFTFDTDPEAAYFGTTSFLLSSDKVLDPWTFVKLRFRRDIAAHASAVAAPDISDPAIKASEDAAWTQGHWVQILPDAGLFNRGGSAPVGQIAARDLTLKVDTATAPRTGKILSFVDKAGATVVLQPTQLTPDPSAPAATGFVSFEFWLVVTVGIQATGFETGKNAFAGEAYVSTVKLDAGEAVLPVALSRPDSSIYVRVIEVQRRIVSNTGQAGAPGSGDALWQELFPDDNPDDPPEPTARIVRVSDPIGVSGPKWALPDPTPPG